MSIRGVRTAAVTLAILVIFTEGAEMATRLGGLGRSLGALATPPLVMLGALAGLAFASCRSPRS